MLTDLKFALRSLAKSPGFTATALATLALCLAANLIIYSAVNAILLRPLPFPEPDRLVRLVNAYPAAGVERSEASVPNYFERRGALKGIASLSIYQFGSVVVGDAGSPNRVETLRVTPEFFATLGVPLALGRMFTEAELSYGTDQVAVLTDSFWRTHFHGDPDILGQTFLNDGLPVVVVGVLPADFHFLSTRGQFFRPFSHAPDDRQAQNRHNNNCGMIGRLAAGATVAEAQAQLDALNAALLGSDPFVAKIKDSGFQTNVFSLHADDVREIRPTLLLLQCGALLLLLIGGVNLANLLLIRASGRTKEVAVRQALGASRFHLAREVLTETLLLATAGGALGLLAGAFGVDLLAKFGADLLPFGTAVVIDDSAVATAAVATLLVGLLLAGPILWFNLRHPLATGLQLESRGGTASAAAQRVRRGFIVAQIALAFVLLSAASLLALSLKRALETSAGFQPGGVLTGKISLPWKNYPDDATRLAFIERLVPAIRSLPGVEHAAVSFDPPFTGGGASGAFRVEGVEEKAGQSGHPHHITTATADYWATLGIPLRRGRLLEDADNHRTERVCVVDQDFVDTYWPGGDAIGRRIANGLELRADRLTTIVGVVANVKQNTLEEAPGHGTVYFPYGLFNSISFSLLVRTELPPESLATAVRKALLAIDPGLPLDDVQTMRDRIDDSLIARRSPAFLAVLFAVAALALAAIGIYGVMAYAVAQRTREFGIRYALGAAAGDVLRMVFGEGTRLALIGLGLGLVGALVLTRYMSSLLFAVKATNPLVYVVTAAVLALVALLACWFPARRATKVDPMVALRAE